MAPSNGLIEDIPLWHRPGRQFFLDTDVVLLARRLLGMKLVSLIDGQLTSGLIVETEAYAGESDRASHASGGRRTQRTLTMYEKGGTAYIYLCYGIHALFNVVTNQPGIPHAVLVRGILPMEGTDIMELRLGRKLKPAGRDGNGPGKLTKLLGIACGLNGIDLTESHRLWIESGSLHFENKVIKVTPRIGVGYAGNDAGLPYRFIVDTSTAESALKKAATR